MLYRALELTVAPTLRAIYRPDVVGFEHLPRTGPVIIAGNHVSFADEVFTPVAARRQVFYFAKAEYFNTPGIKGRSMAALFRAMRQLPVERGDTRSAAASQTRRIVSASPAWNPQATLALVTRRSSPSSSPSRHTPKPSPRSAFRSTART